MTREAIRYVLTCTVAMLAFGIIATLGGCTPLPHPDQPDAGKIITVDKVVVASCIKADEVPTLPRNVGNDLNGDAVHDSAILAAAVLDDRAWQGKALAIIRGCAG